MINKVQPELEDIMEALHRYAIVNNHNLCMIGSFVAFDKNKIENDEEDIFKDGADMNFAFGNKEQLRVLLEELRNQIEDNADEEGFVQI